MDETDWSSDFYSDIFSLGFDNLFSKIDLESLESKENSDLPAPDESRFPLTSNEQIQETSKEAEKKEHAKKYKYVDERMSIRNANLWAFVLGNNTASENQSLVCQVQDG